MLHLWNWLLPPLFGWHEITFWRAVGLLALCRLLFGSFGGRPMWRSNWRRRMGERWESMTPEEREKFRQGMRGRCGSFGSSTPATEPCRRREGREVRRSWRPPRIAGSKLLLVTGSSYSVESHHREV